MLSESTCLPQYSDANFITSQICDGQEVLSVDVYVQLKASDMYFD